MPTYNGFNLIYVAIGAGLLIYAIYVIVAPFISEKDDQPMAKPRVLRGIVALLIGAWFLWASPVDPDNPTNAWGFFAIAIRLGLFRGFWWLIDRHYDPMSEKRKHGSFSKN